MPSKVVAVMLIAWRIPFDLEKLAPTGVRYINSERVYAGRAFVRRRIDSDSECGFPASLCTTVPYKSRAVSAHSISKVWSLVGSTDCTSTLTVSVCARFCGGSFR